MASRCLAKSSTLYLGELSHLLFHYMDNFILKRVKLRYLRLLIGVHTLNIECIRKIINDHFVQSVDGDKVVFT